VRNPKGRLGTCRFACEKWTEEVFIIRHRFLREGIPVYRIQDFEDGNIDGTFYQQELQKVNKDFDDL
jgi:hypothetical protein